MRPESMTLADVLTWLRSAPPGTSMGADALAEWLAPLAAAGATEIDIPAEPTGWREKLWTVPSDVRIGRNELAEALGRPVSWVYRHTSPKSGLPMLPHRKLDGELVFLAGEVRAWVLDHEEVLRSGRMEGPRTGTLHVLRRAG